MSKDRHATYAVLVLRAGEEDRTAAVEAIEGSVARPAPLPGKAEGMTNVVIQNGWVGKDPRR